MCIRDRYYTLWQNSEYATAIKTIIVLFIYITDKLPFKQLQPLLLCQQYEHGNNRIIIILYNMISVDRAYVIVNSYTLQIQYWKVLK